MEKYEKHVTNETKSNERGCNISYCDIEIDQFDWAFVDISHAMNTLEEGGRLRICPDCKKKILEILEK